MLALVAVALLLADDADQRGRNGELAARAQNTAADLVSLESRAERLRATCNAVDTEYLQLLSELPR